MVQFDLCVHYIKTNINIFTDWNRVAELTCEKVKSKSGINTRPKHVGERERERERIGDKTLKRKGPKKSTQRNTEMVFGWK